MITLARILVGLAIAGAPTANAVAQPPGLPNPDLQNRIPAPLPPPPQAPIINGPLGQSPPPGVYLPGRSRSFSDRVTGCLHEGSANGLRGRKLDAYARACANAD
jgi:hypothetical protein